MDGFYHVDQAMDTSPKDPYVISLIYSVVALFLLIPPQEVRSAGLTLERIFQNQLGSEVNAVLMIVHVLVSSK